jgi:hypothetical protein
MTLDEVSRSRRKHRGSVSAADHVTDCADKIFFKEWLLQHVGARSGQADGRTADEHAGNWAIAEDPGHRRYAGPFTQLLVHDHQTGFAAGRIGYRVFLGSGDRADSVTHFLKHFGQKQANHRVIFDDQNAEGCHISRLSVRGHEIVLNTGRARRGPCRRPSNNRLHFVSDGIATPSYWLFKRNPASSEHKVTMAEHEQPRKLLSDIPIAVPLDLWYQQSAAIADRKIRKKF